MIIGIGNKARHGKDTFAELFKQQEPLSVILHWADEVKNELINEERKVPVVRKIFDYYHILEDQKNLTISKKHKNEVPYLDKIFRERGIEVYPGMNDKDGPMLQFWGTDFRRRFYGQKYWVTRLHKKIQEIKKHNPKIKFFLIPDTRYLNEHDYVKNNKGYYVRVIRYNPNGTMFIDSSRDPEHSGEIELDDVRPDFTLHNTVRFPGDFHDIRLHSVEIINKIKKGA